MNLKKYYLFIAFSLFFAVQTHAENDLDLLENGIVYKVVLPALEHKKFRFEVQDNVDSSQNFYITAESPFNDPYEEPIMEITSSQDYSQLCYEQASDYTGICFIPNQKLVKGRQFVLDLYCLVDCQLLVGGYFNEVAQIMIGQNVKINGMKDFGLAQVIEIKIPQKLIYSEIYAIATIQNYLQVTEGIQMYANFGTDNVETPTPQSYMEKGESVFGHAIGIFLTKQEINPGDTMVIYLFSGASMTVNFGTHAISQGITTIEIGKPFVDFTSFGEQKIYEIDLASQIESHKGDENSGDAQNLEDFDLSITVITYSGNPEIAVAFDKQFSAAKSLDNFFIESALKYLITPETRQKMGYKGVVYIRVKSAWSTNYYIDASINRKKFIGLAEGTTELVRLHPKALQNFIFEDQEAIQISQLDENGEYLIQYRLVVKMMGGDATIGVRPCPSLAEGNQIDCLLSSVEDLSDSTVLQSFAELDTDVQQRYNDYTIKFKYNAANCPTYFRNGDVYHICDFHIVISNTLTEDNGGEQNDLYLGVEISKDTIISFLREGKIERGTVSRDSYDYYAFQLANVEDVESMQFFTTTIEGDISIFMSTEDKFPTLDSNGIDMSIMGVLYIDKEQLKEGIYYIAVYGYEISDYTINVAIQRKKTNSDSSSQQTNTTNQTAETGEETQTTIVSLQLGLTQTYVMDKGKSKMLFTFTPSSRSEVSKISIGEISGHVSLKVEEKSALDSPVCSKRLQNENKQCSFPSKFGTNYIITVEAPSDEQQIYSIVYKKQDNCQLYPISFPVYVSMQPGQKTCYQYLISEVQDIEISVSLTPLQIIDKSVQIRLLVNKEQKLTLQGHQRLIKKQQLSDLCFSDKTDASSRKKCSLEVAYENKDLKFSSVFLAVVQTASGDRVLFDGMVEKVTVENLSSENFKKFYFYSESISPLKIFLTSQTESAYKISAKIVSNKQFVQDSEGALYPSFENQQDTDQILVKKSSPNSLTTVLSIPASKFQGIKMDQSQVYVVLISVFGLPKSQIEFMFYAFEIEATQTQAQLPLGDSRIGFVEKDQLYEYKIHLKTMSPTTFQVRPLGSEQCFETYMEETRMGNDSNSNGDLALLQIPNLISFAFESGYRSIIVKGKSQQCTFQVKFSGLSHPIMTMSPGIPYEVKISQEKQINYFLYYHNFPISLRVIQMVDAGDSYIFATPVIEGEQNTIEELLGKQLEEYLYNSGDFDSDFIIDKNSKSFCQNCYYLVAVLGKPSVDMELIVQPINYSIPLKEGSALKDKLELNSVNTYHFYSLTDFNLTINRLYGTYTIKITDPTGSDVVNQKVAEDHRQFFINHPESAEDQSIDYYDQRTLFSIQIVPEQECKYYIMVTKQKAVMRIFEGLPVTLNLKKNEPYSVQFLNLNQNGSIHVLLQNLNYDEAHQENQEQQTINFQVVPINQLKASDNLILSKSMSDGSYNLELEAKKGEYLLTIESLSDMNVSVIVVKESSFTHLKPATTHLITNSKNVFEIFSPGNSVMIEIFTCTGELEVKASRNYSRLTEKNEDEEGIVKMEHTNYGGHYVISSENLKGEYFIQVQGIDNSAVQYQIGYYLYDASKGEKVPYKVYSISDLRIEYLYVEKDTKFVMNQVQRKDQRQVPGKVTYKLYISTDAEAIRKKTKCSLGSIYSLTVEKDLLQAGPSDQQSKVQFLISQKQLQTIIGQEKTFNIGGEAILELNDHDSGHIETAYFVYDVTQLLKNNQPVSPSNKGRNNLIFVVIWIVIPFLIGSVLLYFAARYLIRSFSAYPTQLVDEDGQDNNNNFGPSQDSLNRKGDVDGEKNPVT